MKKITFKIKDAILFGTKESSDSIAVIDTAALNFKTETVDVTILVFPDEETMQKEYGKNFHPSVNFHTFVVSALLADYPKGIDSSDALAIAKSHFLKTAK